MSLMRKKPTPKSIAAARNNGRKSHGPKTETGKQNSALNAIKHGTFAGASPPHLQALGEDPAEFARHFGAFRSAFNPQDGYEEVLVKEIADLHWRLERLKRGEAGLLAWRKNAFQKDREWKAHLARRVRIDAFREYTISRKYKDLLASKGDSRIVHYSGFTPEGDMNSPESPEKYAHILETLSTVRDVTSVRGLEAVQIDSLELVLGDGANCRGSALISVLQACQLDFEKQDPKAQEYRRNCVLQALDEEISYFEKESRLYHEREIEVSPEMADAQLLPSAEDLDRIIRYENHLERLIELKRQQLFAWRREKANAGKSMVPSLTMPATQTQANGNGHEPSDHSNGFGRALSPRAIGNGNRVNH